eukprot:833983-Pelagomonas_calceolata.AAC.5
MDGPDQPSLPAGPPPKQGHTRIPEVKGLGQRNTTAGPQLGFQDFCAGRHPGKKPDCGLPLLHRQHQAHTPQAGQARDLTAVCHSWLKGSITQTRQRQARQET